MSRKSFLAITLLSLLILSFQNCGNSKENYKNNPGDRVDEEVSSFFESISSENVSEDKSDKNESICDAIENGLYDEDYSQEVLNRVIDLLGCDMVESQSGGDQETKSDNSSDEKKDESSSSEKKIKILETRRTNSGMNVSGYSLGFFLAISSVSPSSHGKALVWSGIETVEDCRELCASITVKTVRQLISSIKVDYHGEKEKAVICAFHDFTVNSKRYNRCALGIPSYTVKLPAGGYSAAFNIEL